MSDSPVVLCARQALLLAIRSRWTQIFAVVLAGLSLAVAVAGYALSGGHGVQDLARTSASLAILRFTKGTTGAFLLLSGSLVLWTVVPFALPARRRSRAPRLTLQPR